MRDTRLYYKVKREAENLARALGATIEEVACDWGKCLRLDTPRGIVLEVGERGDSTVVGFRYTYKGRIYISRENKSRDLFHGYRRLGFLGYYNYNNRDEGYVEGVLYGLSPREAYEIAEEIARRVDVEVSGERVLARVQSLFDRGMLAEEQYVALYLLKNVLGLQPHERLGAWPGMGRDYERVRRGDYSIVNEAVRRLLGRLGVERSAPGSAGETLRALVETGYVTVDCLGNTRINSARFTDILRLTIRANPLERVGFDRRLAKAILPLMPADRLHVVLKTPEVVRLAIDAGAKFHPSVMIRRFERGVIWDYLDEFFHRTPYLESLGPRELYEILTRSEYKPLTSGREALLTSRLLALDLNLGNKYLSEHLLDAISTGGATPYHEDGFYGLEYEGLVVQVYRIRGLTRDSPKTFILYPKDTRLGALLGGKTVEEAVSCGKRWIKCFIKDLEKLRQLASRLGFKVVERSVAAGYRIPVFKAPYCRWDNVVITMGNVNDIEEDLLYRLKRRMESLTA